MRKVRAAMVYPMVLLFGSVAVVVLLLTVVVPRLTKFFAQTGYELPVITRFLIALSKFLTAYPILTVAGAGLFAWLVWAAFKTRRGKNILFTIASRLPLSSKLIHRLSVTRFARTLGTLMTAGLDILTALQITAEAVGESRYQRVLLQAHTEISRGVSLNNVLRSRPDLFPHLVVSMVSVGEKTGNLDNVLKTLADFYEEEVDDTLKSLVSLLEPLMLVIMGVVVGGIALAIILPIYQSVGNIR
ncbi:MAG: type II secretion system F family protein [Candidatus Kerfeldbacteria bacterium]|nr:type II secretion system F family protein [Candidatus Kerfeldbacteria bacterium]